MTTKARPARRTPPPGRSGIAITTRLLPDELEKLQALAKGNDRSVNKEISRALRSWLAQHDERVLR